ncbi:hypothetical protein C8R42DRAFT_649117 [Lentinula raphanica]|nr:hypothetical protein C8R42DRAFT_649117 [Lentinula raphanica]
MKARKELKMPARAADDTDDDVVWLEKAPVLSKEQVSELEHRKTRKELENTKKRLQQAEQTLLEIRAAAQERTMCDLCFDVYSDPHILPCGHVFCGGCISIHAKKRSGNKQNGFCPTCRQAFGHFTPIVAYNVKRDVEDMQKDQGLHATVYRRLDWPLDFKGPDATFPFTLDAEEDI